MTIKLYTVTVESEFVFASESDDLKEVKREVRRKLRHDPDMSREIVDGDTTVSPMAHLPGNYERDQLPWGVAGDKTIGEHIDAGAAPEYTSLLGRLKAAAVKP